jgi:hypothetical protein
LIVEAGRDPWTGAAFRKHAAGVRMLAERHGPEGRILAEKNKAVGRINALSGRINALII